jgi:CBS domain-containing protein
LFVSERMSHPVIAVSPEMPIVEALNLMKREHIRRTPVVKNGKLVEQNHGYRDHDEGRIDRQ